MLSVKNEEEKLKKRMDNFERRVNSRINKLERNFKVYNEIINNLEKEKKSLLDENNKLKTKYKTLLEKLEEMKQVEDVKDNYIVPVNNKINETLKLFQYAGEPKGEEKFQKEMKNRRKEENKKEKEFLSQPEIKSLMKDLPQYVEERGNVRLSDLSSAFGMKEKTIEKTIEFMDGLELIYPTIGKPIVHVT